MKILKSVYFWASLLLLPLLLVGCSKLFVDFDSDFVSDEYVARETIQSNDLTVSYLRSGDPKGQRVIFVHGTPGEAGSNWYDQLKNVPNGYEYIAIDRPGFGRTLPKEEVTSLNGQAAAIEPLLKSGNGKSSILVGHSLGGPVVAVAAINYPDQIRGIVIAAGALDPDLEDVLFVQHIGDIPPFSWLLTSTLKHSNRELIALEAELRMLQPKLKEIEQPVVIVHGTEDKLVPYANVPFMQRELTGTSYLETITIDGMNHFLQWRAKEELQQGIDKITSHPTLQ